MKIEEGKFYKMRNGNVVGPMIRTVEDGLVLSYTTVEPVDHYIGMWAEHGIEEFFSDANTGARKMPEYDLVEEAQL